MDKFKNRIKYYLIGFSFGIVAVIFFFGGRGCAWLPENRVKNTISENAIIYGDSIKSVLECLNKSNEDIYALLNNSGDVNFKESQTKVNPKQYLIEGENDFKAVFEINEKYSEIISVPSAQSCDIHQSNNHKQEVPLPSKIVNSIIESHEFTFYPETKCQMSCLNIDSTQVESFHLSAKINMQKSRPWPPLTVDGQMAFNPIYTLEGTINKTNITMTYEIGENRTRIVQIQSLDKECECE